MTMKDGEEETLQQVLWDLLGTQVNLCRQISCLTHERDAALADLEACRQELHERAVAHEQCLAGTDIPGPWRLPGGRVVEDVVLGVVVEPTTRCKHGAADCPRCGTTSRRDAVHTTIGGHGAVARIKGGTR